VWCEHTVFEVEWAKHWTEAPGQALLYRAHGEGRKGGVILLMRDKPTEILYYMRCAIVCADAGLILRTWDTR